MKNDALNNVTVKMNRFMSKNNVGTAQDFASAAKNKTNITPATWGWSWPF
jgi:hypothetical protein